MAEQDQDQVPQGAIPPKVTPFAKPEGAAPAPPVVAGAPRPITVRLRPATAAVGIPTPPSSANPRATARVPIPESIAAEPVAVAAPPATVRLRPVAFSAPAPAAAARAAAFTAPGSTQPITAVPVPLPAYTVVPGSTQSIAPMNPNPSPAPAASPLQPQHPPTPGSNPLPNGPKQPSGAQVQASKSKTSRISLDSAIGVAPMTPMSGDKSEPKTIRLKRPTDLAAPTAKPAASAIRQTSRIPDAALPTAEESSGAETSSVTQKKTLKIKRPGMKEEGAAPEGGAGAAFGEGVQMTPIGSMDFPAKKESSVFTAIAVFAASIAAVLLLMLTLCLGAHAVGPNAGRNSLASIRLGSFEFFWPGRIAN